MLRALPLDAAAIRAAATRFAAATLAATYTSLMLLMMPCQDGAALLLIDIFTQERFDYAIIIERALRRVVVTEQRPELLMPADADAAAIRYADITRCHMILRHTQRHAS